MHENGALFTIKTLLHRSKCSITLVCLTALVWELLPIMAHAVGVHMGNLKQFLVLSMFTTFTLVSSSAMANEGPGGSGGGDYIDEELLDRVEFGKKIDPRLEFKSVYTQKMKPILERVRQDLPDLADDLDRVFVEKSWYLATGPLAIRSGTEPGSIVDQALRRGIFQTQDFVIVVNDFAKKSMQAKADGMIHEGVRFLMAQRAPHRDGFDAETNIRRLTMKIILLGRENSKPAVFRQEVADLGLNYYLTSRERQGLSALIREFYSLVCEPRTEALGFDKPARERAVALAKIIKYRSEESPEKKLHEFSYTLNQCSSEEYAKTQQKIELYQYLIEKYKSAYIERIRWEEKLKDVQASLIFYDPNTKYEVCNYFTPDWFKSPEQTPEPKEDDALIGAAIISTKAARSLASLEGPKKELHPSEATRVGAKPSAELGTSPADLERKVNAAR